MSWCINIVINEASKKEALKLLEEIVEDIKSKDDIFIEGPVVDGYWGKMMQLQRFKYDSYWGGFENENTI